MPFFTLAFLAGDLYLQTLSHLPQKEVCVALIFLAAFCCFLLRRFYSLSLVVIGFAAGFLYSNWYAVQSLADRLPLRLQDKQCEVEGYIASLPIIESKQAKFQFDITSLGSHPIRVRLTWRYAAALHVGDKWHFAVKLKRIHGTQNPGSFDFEKWAYANGLKGSGYVLQSVSNQFITHDPYRYMLQQTREKIQNQLNLILPHSSTAPWLLALMTGERQSITKSDWEVLRNTGTNHLMAIAGLHIGILAGISFFAASWLWRRNEKCLLFLPAKYAGALVSLGMVMLYSALAGFSLPTERASFMLLSYILVLLSKRRVLGWYPWLFALLLVLILNPLNVLSESFYLSFGTLALIYYCMQGRMNPGGLWWHWGRTQWVIGIGLLPLTAALFQQYSLISFIANIIAIPWLSFFILPFCFLSLLFLFFSMPLSHGLLILADKSLSVLWMILSALSKLPIAVWYFPQLHGWTLFSCLIATLILLLPAGIKGRFFSIIWFMPLLFINAPKPHEKEIDLYLLDVGQGLSVVVQTRSHVLVFDAGPRFFPHYDAGNEVVVPFLRTKSIDHVDMLVISHGDNDHLGGASSLLLTLPVNRIKTSVPKKLLPFKAGLCKAGDTWQWDGVYFTFLYPDKTHLQQGNNSSCVLRIDNGKNQILLTGDIEKKAEDIMVAHYQESILATIMVAPHHGSKTSSSLAFIKAVKPQFVLYATGYHNRYHFPHAKVKLRYKKLSVQAFNTAEAGMIQFHLGNHAASIKPVLYREIYHPYWFN